MLKVTLPCSSRWTIAFSLFALIWPLFLRAAAAERGGKSARTQQIDLLFSSPTIPRIAIEVPDGAMEILKKAQWRFDAPQGPRENVRVTVREGQMVYTNVALHLKGAAGSFRSIDQNPAMTLDFDEFVPSQRFHGLGKLSLNNSVQDPTFVSEQLCRELFLKAGVPTPRATHAFVQLNGRDLGLYVLTEGWDKQFLKRHFKNTSGNLYDGGFLKDVDAELSVNSGDRPKDQADRIALADAAKESDLATRWARLEKLLDLDRFLTFIALDVMLWDWDGYAQNRNNWRLFHDRDTGKLVFMPHGLDQMFWKADGPILPGVQGLVAKAVLEIPELRQRYFERMKALRRTVFLPEQMTNRAHQISAKFASQLQGADPAAAAEQGRALGDFCSAIVRRAEHVDAQLAHPIEPIQFDADGSARLAAWEERADFGKPLLARSSQGPGPVLEVGAANGSSIGGWATKVWLEKGRYQITGKVKTVGISPDPGDPRGGAGFRAGRRHPDGYLQGSNDWQLKTYEFTMDDLLGELQIVCEFRGAEGKAFFDQDSVRLQRLKSKE